MSDAPNATQDGVKELMEQRTALESQLKDKLLILEVNKVGMDEPLVDSEGYPRADIDVYKVRHARKDIICLRNDLKALMARIEDGLHSLHRQSREGVCGPSDVPRPAAESLPECFARVSLVDDGSPASEAGLRAGDEIAQFGSINADNFATMRNLSEVTYSSKGQALKVTVLRGGDGLTRRAQKLELTPKPWDERANRRREHGVIRE